MEDSTSKKVFEVILRQFRIAPQTLSRETTFGELGADSVAMVELMVNLADAFEMHIPDATATDVQTVGHIIDFVDRSRMQQSRT